jgi:hypothetical protein
MPYSNAKKAAVLDASVTENWYIGLSSTDPTVDGSGVTEVKLNGVPADGYARQLIASADGWSAATVANPSVKSNAAVIEFPEATADWLAGADLVYAPLYDAATNGNYVGYAVITSTPKGFLSGDVARFAIGAVRLQLT